MSDKKVQPRNRGMMMAVEDEVQARYEEAVKEVKKITSSLNWICGAIFVLCLVQCGLCSSPNDKALGRKSSEAAAAKNDEPKVFVDESGCQYLILGESIVERSGVDGKQICSEPAEPEPAEPAEPAEVPWPGPRS